MRLVQKHKIWKIGAATLLLVVLLAIGRVPGVAAACTGNGTADPSVQCATSTTSGETQTCPDGSVISVDSTCSGDSCANSSDCTDPAVTDAQNCSGNSALQCTEIFTKFIDPLMKFLAIGVGVIVVIMVIVGGVQYVTSAGNPQAATNARKRILNAVLAFVVFIFLYALLDWLVPGGVPLR